MLNLGDVPHSKTVVHERFVILYGNDETPNFGERFVVFTTREWVHFADGVVREIDRAGRIVIFLVFLSRECDNKRFRVNLFLLSE